MGLVLELTPLLARRRQLREQGKTVVLTNGCFDLLHVGHVRYLRQARALGHVLIVGLNSDASARRLKGPQRPLVPAAQRAEVLAALACVDFVVIFDEPTAERLVNLLQPEIYAKGGDYASKDLPEQAVVESYGGRVVLLLQVLGMSTTDIVSRIRATACEP